MTTPADPIYRSWTSSQWEQWFRDDVASTRRWKDLEDTLDSIHETHDLGDLLVKEGSLARDPATGMTDEPLRSAVDALVRSHVIPVPDSLRKEGSTSGPLDHADWAVEFSLMSAEFRQQLFEGWLRVNPVEFAPPPDPALLPQPWWRVSKPMAWVAAGAAATILVAGTWIIVDKGDAAESPQAQPALSEQDDPIVTEPGDTADTGNAGSPNNEPADDPADPEPAVDADSAPSGTTTDSVDDPFGDLYRTWDDLSPIDPDRSVDGVSGQDVMDATDSTAMQVVSNADDAATEITLSFAGDAQEAHSENGKWSLAGDVLIYQSNGRILNILIRDDGSVKISDAPSGMSITSQWLSPEQFLIVITGLALNPGTQVEATTLIEAYGGFMSDTLSLITSNP